jgi:hypothetical protein
VWYYNGSIWYMEMDHHDIYHSCEQHVFKTIPSYVDKWMLQPISMFVYVNVLLKFIICVHILILLINYTIVGVPNLVTCMANFTYNFLV